MSGVIIGLVGYYQFVRGYPIGPELREKLERQFHEHDDCSIQEMNWGPIAIVQDFQANPVSYDRVVLVAGVDRGLASGSVTCRRWIGGELDVMAVQKRVFEAVTGVIGLDNLLVIGEYFGIWPDEVITVEIQLADSAFGDLVLSELELGPHDAASNVVGENPLAPEMKRIMEKACEMASNAAKKGVLGVPNIETLDVRQLSRLADVCHNQLLQDGVAADKATVPRH